jgi:hypothetical protein
MILLGQKDGRDVYLLPQIEINDDVVNFNCMTDFDGTMVQNLGGEVAVPETLLDEIKANLGLDE